VATSTSLLGSFTCRKARNVVLYTKDLKRNRVDTTGMSLLKIVTDLLCIPARTELVWSASRNMIIQLLWDVTPRRLVKVPVSEDGSCTIFRNVGNSFIGLYGVTDHEI
jgi:hypothetical protein